MHMIIAFWSYLKNPVKHNPVGNQTQREPIVGDRVLWRNHKPTIGTIVLGEGDR